MITKIKKHFGDDLKDKLFCMWGLSFKPKTDDMREAPSLVIIEALVEAGAKIRAYDPVAAAEAKHLVDASVEIADDAMEATKSADALLLVTEWPEFRLPDWDELKANMKGNVIFDGRNIYHNDELSDMGFVYYGIGTGK